VSSTSSRPDGGYDGKTLGALATTGSEKYRTRVEPLMPGVAFIPFGDTTAAVAAIDSRTAAFIVEPLSLPRRLPDGSSSADRSTDE
jgi:acetylornithine/succinyldiaminopimelate/putrescine aminotransferase